MLVAGATYNPTPCWHYAWAKNTGWEWRPPIVFVGVVLLANAFLAALRWLLADCGWLPIEDVAAISWIGLFGVAIILAIGMSWSHGCRAAQLGVMPRLRRIDRDGCNSGHPSQPPEAGQP